MLLPIHIYFLSLSGLTHVLHSYTIKFEKFAGLT